MRLLKFLFSRFFICISIIAALTAAIIFLCLYIHSLLPAAAAAGLSYVLSAAATVSVESGDLAPDFMCSWLAVIILFPVAGTVIYTLFILGKPKERAGEVQLKTGFDGFEYFADGGELLKSLTAAVAKAERSVYLEFYIIARGGVWRDIYAALIDALSRGVEVKIICDGLGSALRAPTGDFKRLKRAGARVKIFNRLVPAPLTRLNFRDHRKIAVIDGGRVYLGGVNIADEYAHLTSPHGFWKDGGALFCGDIAKTYEAIFLSLFCGKKITEGGKATEGKQPSEKGKISDGKQVNKGGKVSKTDACAFTGGFAELLTRSLYKAEERAYIFTPYLMTGGSLFSALCDAAERGVDVRIMLPGIPDKKLTYAVTKSFAKKLSARGVKVYCYTPGFMHFKGAAVDGCGYLGSYNLDYRSLHLNYECGVYANGALAESIAGDFLSALENCSPFVPPRVCMPQLAVNVLSPLL